MAVVSVIFETRSHGVAFVELKLYLDLVALIHRDLPAFASQLQGLMVCATVPDAMYTLKPLWWSSALSR